MCFVVIWKRVTTRSPAANWSRMVSGVTAGKAVLEFAVINTDKGEAVDILRDRTASTAVVFLGDDVTDEKAFARMRNSRHCFSDWGNEALPAGIGDPAVPPVLETVIGPGEAIFLPVGWWHQVEALDLSASMSFTSFRRPNNHADDYASWGEL